MKQVLFLFFMLVAERSMHAQHRIGNFMAYGGDHGLPASFYYTVWQSSDGYLWIGSSSGLIRFDGKRYKTFFSDYTDPNSLSDNVVNDIIEDDKQNLWIAGLYQGLTKYNLRTGLMKRYASLSADATSGLGIKQLLFSAGELWIATEANGLARYVPETDSFEFFQAYPSDDIVDTSSTITGIVQDRKDPDVLWLSSHTGLYSFQTKEKVFAQYTFPHPVEPHTPLPFLCIEASPDNSIWLGSWYAGLLRFDTDTKQFYNLTYADADPRHTNHYLVLDIKCVNDSVLYLATGNDGLLWLNIHGQEMHPLLTQDQLPDGSSGIDIQRISVTPDAGVFVGGNYFIYQEHAAFNRFSRTVTFAYEAQFQMKQVIYDSHRNGYWMAYINTGEVIFFDADMMHQRVYRAADGKPIQALDIAMDVHQRVWVTTVHSGLLVLRKTDTTFHDATKVFPASQEFSTQLFAVENDDNGNLWFVRSTQLFYMDGTSGKIQSFDFALNHVANGYGISLKCGSRGDAWVGTNNGLYHCLPDQNKIVQLLPDTRNPDGIANAYIKSMTVDMEGNAWVGFENDGVQVISSQDHKLLKKYNLDNGLPCMQVNYMATDTAGGIWAGTAAGLAYFNPDASAQVWQLFNRHDGVKRDYIDRPIAITKTNKLFFNVESGISWIDIQAKKEMSTSKPKLRVLSFQVDGQPYQYDLLPEYLTAVELDYNVKEIRIEFAAMDWLHPFRTKYFYRIARINAPDEWIENNEAMISLSGMKPGQYELQVYAVSGDGIKSNELKLPVRIHPPFWQRWWFGTLIVLGAFLLGYGIYRYRINQFQKLQSMRNTISNNLHDDIGASLSNIHILTVLTQRNISNSNSATAYITKAGDEIQRISESLSDIVWNINPRYDDLDNLFVRMKRYAADMLEGKNIRAELIFPEESVKVTMPMDQRRDFYLIFKEAINNLVKYSDATEVLVKVDHEHHVIRMEIQDNGRGFDEHAIQHGNGIQNMKQRAEKWKAVLRVMSKPGAGAKILLEMKIS